MASFMAGKALKLDGNSYLYADNADFSGILPFYVRVSFRCEKNPSAKEYQYIVSYNPSGETMRFYIRLYTNDYLQTYLQVFQYSNTGNYINFQVRIDGAEANNKPHLKNSPFTVEYYWDGDKVSIYINGWHEWALRYSLSGDGPWGGLGTLAVGTQSNSLGNNNFYGFIDDIVIGQGWPWDDRYDSVSHRFSWGKWGTNIGENTGNYLHAWSFDSENGNDEIGDWHLDNAGGYPAYAEGLLGTWAGETITVYRDVPLMRARLMGPRLRGRIRE